MYEWAQDLINFILRPENIASWVVGLLITVLTNYYLHKRSQIKINEEAEKIKYEMQRKYLQFQIKTKNLLETYPKMYQLMRESGSLVVVFDTINKKIDEIPLEKRNDIKVIKPLLSMYLGIFIETHKNFGLESIRKFADYIEASSLFTSKQVDELANQAKQSLMSLYYIVKNEIIDDKYLEYDEKQLSDLLKRANDIKDTLSEIKNQLQKQMYQELNP